MSYLLQVPAAVRFLSCEPLLDEVNFTWSVTSGWSPKDQPGACIWHDVTYYPDRDYDGEFTGGEHPEDSYDAGIHWVIVGGESGSNAREMELGWAKDIVRQCKAAHVPVFVKQLGDNPTNRKGEPCPRITAKKGNDPSEWPAELRVREFPEVQHA